MKAPDEYILTRYTQCDYFTAGKFYPVWARFGYLCRVIDDEGIPRLVVAPGRGVCAHLGTDGEWQPVKALNIRPLPPDK